MSLTIAQLAKQIGADTDKNRSSSPGLLSKEITAVGPVRTAGENEITFVSDDRHQAALADSCAGAVIVPEFIADLNKPQLVVKNVNAALIEVLKIFAPKLKAATPGIDPTARLGDKIRIAEGVSIGAYVVIDDGVEIGQNSIIGRGCKIGENSKIGKNCRLDSNVVIYHNCRLGNNIVIQANSTIGSTGFGYSFIEGAHRLIPHNGGVIIEDFVEIGANCCIDRAKFDNTIIGAGTKIDNLVQIAHNVIIGKCCLITALCGISGSCTLGNGVVLGGQAGIKDNIEIGDGTMIGAQAGVIQNIAAGQTLFGTPAIDKNEKLRIFSASRRLPDMAKQIKQLIKRVEKLEAAEDNKE
ncbi:MAG: UDP-3-O-(3-hydroxymyristoyl)glucosamine N-acyltransferase [Sedimentisphaerales bacterium]|nr:UDP-3-O-(3-hydroxymyristoyl)glucosamine N-acyltransferase [Sedimentisphaerales bacterium]